MTSDDPSLYERDFLAWSEQQAAALRRLAAARSNVDLDLTNLAEEIADLGDNTLAVVDGLLLQVLSHLLKLEHSPAAGPREHWLDEIGNWRALARRRLRRSPSALHKIDLAELYEEALPLAARSLARDGVRREDLPVTCPYTLDQVLDDFVPANRHGLSDT